MQKMQKLTPTLLKCLEVCKLCVGVLGGEKLHVLHTCYLAIVQLKNRPARNRPKKLAEGQKRADVDTQTLFRSRWLAFFVKKRQRKEQIVRKLYVKVYTHLLEIFFSGPHHCWPSFL